MRIHRTVVFAFVFRAAAGTKSNTAQTATY